MATLPTLTRLLDDHFVNTWYDIRDRVVDNVLEATPFSLALKEYGCMKPQIGGEFGWTDTIGYGDTDVETQRFQEGSTVTQKPIKLDTFASLDWRYFCVDVNRSMITDKKNMGKYQIKSYLSRRLEAARTALVRDIESYLTQWGAFYSAPLQPNGLFDIVAPTVALTQNAAGTSSEGDSDTQAAGTANGKISRANAWWKNWAATSSSSFSASAKTLASATTPYALNLVPNMTNWYNTISDNMEPPNFIMSAQDLYEAYEDEARDKMQIVRTSYNKKAADLGFESQTFKGQPWIYSSKMVSKSMVMLNMDYVFWNYHPDLWFDMTDWRHTHNQFERVAYIVCMTPGLATNQPRRHGYMLYAG